MYVLSGGGAEGTVTASFLTNNFVEDYEIF